MIGLKLRPSNYSRKILVLKTFNWIFSFGYWNKDAEEIKKFLEDKIIFAKAETSGSTSADLIALNDLESEINSNKKSLERLVNSGNEMIQDDHYAKTDIQGRIRLSAPF